jgi:hypothetical protein
VARDEDDDGGGVERRQQGGDLEAVDVGQVHVDEHELGPELADAGDGRFSVRRLSDHPVALRLEHSSRRGAEARVVVDYENGCVHLPSRFSRPRPVRKIRLPAPGSTSQP